MEQEKLINLLLGKELSDRQLDAILKKGMGCGKVHPEKNCTHDGWGVIENLFAPTYLNLSTVLSYILLGGITIICFSCFIVASQKEETLFLILAFSLLLLVIYLFTKEDRAKYALMKKRLKALETQNANALREKWESRYESIHGEKPKFGKNLENESDAFLARFFGFLGFAQYLFFVEKEKRKDIIDNKFISLSGRKMNYPNIVYREKLGKACETAKKQSQELLNLLVQACEKNVFTDKVLADGVRVWESFNSVIREVERVNRSAYTPDNRRKLVDATSSIKCVIDALHSSLPKHNEG